MRHKSQLAGTKQQFKRRTSEELFDLKAKLNRVSHSSHWEVCKCQPVAVLGTA